MKRSGPFYVICLNLLEESADLIEKFGGMWDAVDEISLNVQNPRPSFKDLGSIYIQHLHHLPILLYNTFQESQFCRICGATIERLTYEERSEQQWEHANIHCSVAKYPNGIIEKRAKPGILTCGD
ncbi:hypothetical protein TNIN_482381 [Trichonephila inaurata madagascariensis]|uniref:Uncharacterized protein n=1 Tax=Trichonephila inaurata madagascariensis TaxID=2747483 RepID=A0A8X6JUY8_9ARAC|nr:hypothetical protein TNIN_482381 [Trichonephila inaurata madagascariensis]